MKHIIQGKTIDPIERRRIIRTIIKLFQEEGLSYQQAVDTLDDTKDQLRNIPINFSNLQLEKTTDEEKKIKGITIELSSYDTQQVDEEKN